MTPIERAARAVEAAIFDPTLRANISIECDDPARVHQAVARAVIAAIREQSEAVGMAVFEAAQAKQGGTVGEYASSIWTAGIDALLEGKA